MKILIIRNGRCTFHPAWGPIVDFSNFEVDDEVDTKKIITSDGEKIKDEFIAKLEEKGWISILESDSGNLESVDEEFEDHENMDEETNKVGSSDEETVDAITENELRNLIGGKSADEQKQLLQDWGVLNLNVKISKANSVEKMIEKIIASASEN